MSSQALVNMLPVSKKPTPAPGDHVLHAAFLLAGFVAPGQAAALGGGF